MPRGITDSRAEEVSGRRRKSGSDGKGLKLWVPEGTLDPKFAHRWADDKDNRLSALTQNDDYDFVNQPGVDGEEGRVKRIVGTHNGKPLYSYLLRKAKTYYDADQKAKAEKIGKVEKEIKRGGVKHVTDLGGETTSDVNSLYTPGGRDGVSGVNIIGDR